jgi:hypothetical protein
VSPIPLSLIFAIAKYRYVRQSFRWTKATANIPNFEQHIRFLSNISNFERHTQNLHIHPSPLLHTVFGLQLHCTVTQSFKDLLRYCYGRLSYSARLQITVQRVPGYLRTGSHAHYVRAASLLLAKKIPVYSP